MSVTRYEVRAGAYYDSVMLMQLQKGLAAMPGVVDAGAVMATPANRELLIASDLLSEEEENVEAAKAKANDLLIVVKANDETSAAAALSQVDELFKRRRSTRSQGYQPRTLAAASDAMPEAKWVLISVPGRYAAGVAQEALRLGKHVFLYSDNVALDDEIALKKTARDRSVMVMGPDCGTAIINGIGFGFANRVRRGDIGLVGASGTGLQAITTEIHNLGAGVSQAIGTGGRDLWADVAAITTHQGLGVLADDIRTNVIVLVSKPPSSSVVTQLMAAAQHVGKPVVVNLIGYPVPGRQLGNIHFAPSLGEAAQVAVQLSRANSVELPEAHKPFSGYMRGLFSGGTIAYEVVLGLQAILSPLYTNTPIRQEQRLEDVWLSQGHTILDLGEDEFTQGRLHPMMDNDLRLRRMRQEIADEEVDLILLDIVLGEGAHPDPAGELCPLIAEAIQHGKRVVAIVIGTDDDPQNLNAQIEALIAAGATVFATVDEALDYVYDRIRSPEPGAYPSLEAAAFQEPLAAINVGLDSFYESMKAQGAEAIQVDWRPPAGGDEKLMAILARMKSRE